MEEVVYIYKPKPHSGQRYIIERYKRFNVVANGRRWGKTKETIRLHMETLLAGFPSGAFFPTYDFANDFWEEIKDRLEPITVYKSESKRIIRLNTGGELNVHSLEKKRSGRGKKYKRVTVDEGAFVKDLRESWEKVIRATLTDLEGDAFFFSSPVFGTYFHELAMNAGKPKFENWTLFQMATNTNPMIPQAELDQIKSQLDPLTWAQEFEAEFVNLTGNAFAHCFKRAKHVRDCGDLKKQFPVRLSFDFNVNPMTCTASQHHPEHKWIYTRHEFRIENSNIYDMCDLIKTKLGDEYYLTVTGDATGQARSGMTADNINYYTIIKAKLGLEDEQFDVPKINPFVKNNRVLCNSLLYRHPKMFIHPDCEYLIKDLELVQVLTNHDIDKKSNPKLTHLLDTWRYYINTYFKSFVKI